MNPKELLEWFRVPKYNDVYALGSFAKRVTLYSQQVRALNLVAALVKERIICAGREVVVIGGGAAGLTAAAGAACHGARIILLEELYGLMESQRNNRQRWIHPHIYDWPAPGSKDEEADLPILGWNAAYAEQVVNQIERKWDDLCLYYPINIQLGVKGIKITRNGTDISIKWKGSIALKNPVIILAIGFGLEPKTQYQDSYWTEDDIDGGFRKSSRKQKWLISGFGDGALTDLMRLCITHFRHGKIVDVFRTESGIVEVEEQLKRMPQSSSPALLTEGFRQLRLDSLIQGLQDIKREGLEVSIAGPDPFLYGPKASVLNRLIVRVLEKMKRFKLLKGPTKDIIRSKKGYRVRVGKTKPRYFDRVIVRHGPKPCSLEESFRPIWTACTPLKSKWDNNRQPDKTQVPAWEGWMVSFTGSEPTPASPSEAAFRKALSRFKVRASKLVVSKELRNDGSSTMTYEIKGLSVGSRQLSGMRFCFESTFGQYGTPELDQAARNAGFQWKEDQMQTPTPAGPVNFKSAILATRERMRRVAGTVLFPKPLKNSSNPVNFALTVRVLNGDALSNWEFEQLYSPKERLHVDHKSSRNATEYMARIVWFPVDRLKLRITLPRRIPGSPYSSVFMANGADSIPVQQVVHKGIVQNNPPPESGLRLGSSNWKRQPANDSVQSRQLNSSGQTWELSVSTPPVGSCFSLDWPLPNITGNTASRNNEAETAKFRHQMLKYRASRMKGRTGGEIGNLFKGLYWKFHSKYKSIDPQEQFALSLLTYDEGDRHLKVIDGALNNGEPPFYVWEFWLPYGSGLSGACFKQQESFPLIYFAPESGGDHKFGPEPYLPLPNLKHRVLLAVPLDHPDYANAGNSTSFETARQRLGVIDIGSDSKTSKLGQLRRPNSEGDFKEINKWCQDFCRDLCAALRAHHGKW